MRLLSVIHNPVYGGAHAQFLRLREPLAELGVESIVLTSDEPASGLERMRAAGAEVIAMPLHRLRANPDPRIQARFLTALPREVAAVRDVIAARGIDVVQAHAPIHFQGPLAARGTDTAVVWQIYDTATPNWLRRATMPAVTRLADVITTWGRALAEDHPGATSLGERCITVFPPVDVERFAAAAVRRDEAREELGIPADAIAIGTVGNRNRAKGHDLLIEAAGALAERRADVVFRILGASSEGHEAYEQELHERARELGLGDRLRWVDPGSRVVDLIGGLDVFTMTSPRNSEGMPTAILEAMAAGLPVVSTNSGAVREEIVEGESGYVVEPGRPDELTRRWEELAADPQLRARLGEAGGRVARERFDLRTLATVHKRAYDLAVAHRAQGRANSS